MQEFIGYGKQWITDEDIQAVIETLKSDYLTQGPKVTEFEQAICDYTGARYCIACANGTAALHLAVAALNIENGMEGITSPNTFVATANALCYNDLSPIFADIDDKTYCIDPGEIMANLTNKTKVILPVHFAGQPCDMVEIQRIADMYGLYVIEDAAHAIGSKYADGSTVGNCKYSDMTIFSFHPVKTITTGEGGAITTNNPIFYERLKMLVTHGITRNSADFVNHDSKSIGPWYYEMQELGYNYRLTDFQAALGISQLKRLDEFVKRRREIIKIYNEAFDGLEWLTTPFESADVFSAFHLYVVLIDFDKIGKTRTEVMNELKNKNIGTQVHYIPVHLQPYYTQNYNFKPGDYPVAEKYYEKALSLPLYPKMTNEQIGYVVDNILGLIK